MKLKIAPTCALKLGGGCHSIIKVLKHEGIKLSACHKSVKRRLTFQSRKLLITQLRCTVHFACDKTHDAD
jgi:hypothetical protein